MAHFKKTGKVTAAVELPECPVCLETMTAPIFQCQSGHSLCSSCSDNLCPSICPICRQNMTRIRNLQLEEIVNKAKVPCANANIGCKFTVPAGEKDEHLKECIFRDMECPIGTVFGKCSWQGKLQDMMNHFKERHPTNCNVQQDTDIVLNNIRLNQDDRHFFLVQNENKMIFMLTMKLDTLSKAAYWTVQLVGCKRAAQQHIYEIQVNSRQDERRKVIFIEHCYSDTIRADDVFRQQGKCAIVPLDSLKHFIQDSKLTFRFNIKRIAPVPFKGKQEKAAGKNENHDKPQHQGEKGQGFKPKPKFQAEV